MPLPAALVAAAPRLAGAAAKAAKLAKAARWGGRAVSSTPSGRRATNRALKVIGLILAGVLMLPIVLLLALAAVADHVLNALEVKPTIRVAVDAYRAAAECPFATDTTVGSAAGAAYLVAGAWALTSDDVRPGGVYGGYRNPFGGRVAIPDDIRALADPAELAEGGSVHNELGLHGSYGLGDWTTVLGASRVFGSWVVNPLDPLGGEHGVGFLLIRPSDWRAWVKDVPVNLTHKLDPWRPYDSFLVLACHLERIEREAGLGMAGVTQALVQYGNEEVIQVLDAVFDPPGRVLQDMREIVGRVLGLLVDAGTAFAGQVLDFMGMAQDMLHLGQSQPSAFALRDIPQQYLALIRKWAAPDLDWTILAGVLKVECDFGRNCGVSSTGALGPAQFEPGTWAQYGLDGDGDGVKDPWNPADAVAGEANYLRHLGLGRQATVRSALCHYNTGGGPGFQACMDGGQRPDYADVVMSFARQYRGPVDLGSALGAIAGAPTQAAQVAIDFALRQLGLPYVFGAAGPNAFDCSGLVQAAYAAAGVHLPRVSRDQYAAGPHVPPGAPLMPGDLVFFDGSDPPIGHVGMALSSTTMIDAPHTGAVVRIEPIWHDGYVGATRPSG